MTLHFGVVGVAHVSDVVEIPLSGLMRDAASLCNSRQGKLAKKPVVVMTGVGGAARLRPGHSPANDTLCKGFSDLLRGLSVVYIRKKKGIGRCKDGKSDERLTAKETRVQKQ